MRDRNDIVTSFEKEDYPNYTIFVHALKSTAKMIGANDLSEKARLLEQAGKDGDIDYIRSHHDEMIQEYSKVVEEIKDYLDQKSN